MTDVKLHSSRYPTKLAVPAQHEYTPLTLFTTHMALFTMLRHVWIVGVVGAGLTVPSILNTYPEPVAVMTLSFTIKDSSSAMVSMAPPWVRNTSPIQFAMPPTSTVFFSMRIIAPDSRLSLPPKYTSMGLGSNVLLLDAYTSILLLMMLRTLLFFNKTPSVK